MSNDSLPLKLYKKLHAIYKGIEKIPKNGYNEFHKYKYVLEADVVEHCRKLFIDNKIILTTSCSTLETIKIEGDDKKPGDITRLFLDITLTDTESGESITIPFIGDGQDKGDKGIYKAYAGGVKYFLMKNFMIPADINPEDENSGAKKSNPRKKNAEPQTVKDPVETSVSANVGELFKEMKSKVVFMDFQKAKDWAKEYDIKNTEIAHLTNWLKKQEKEIDQDALNRKLEEMRKPKQEEDLF